MKKVIVPIVLVAVAIIVAYTFLSSEEDYVTLIEKHREEQRIFLKDSDESPFNQFNISFNGLNYFKPNPEFNIKADIVPFTNKQLISLATSTGEKEDYLKFGKATFTINNESVELVLLQPLNKQNILFIAFTDATSAEETYGAGRYIDLDYNGESRMMIDFNKAYNPYCAFVDDYSCPLPLPENNLTVSILAGEKSYQ